MTVHPSWRPIIDREAAQPYFSELRVRVLGDRATGPVYPPQGATMAALAVPLHAVRCVILGQDPYHAAGQACGLAFSVPPGVPPPPSLRAVLREVSTDAVWDGRTGDLSPWVAQGVLLLNAILTVRANAPGSHRGAGWERFTAAILREVASQDRVTVWMLWGADARRAAESAWAGGPLADGPRHPIGPGEPGVRRLADHLILTAPHPSPLAARGGRSFAGCGHFRRADEWMASRGEPPIDWSLGGAS